MMEDKFSYYKTFRYKIESMMCYFGLHRWGNFKKLRHRAQGCVNNYEVLLDTRVCDHCGKVEAREESVILSDWHSVSGGTGIFIAARSDKFHSGDNIYQTKGIRSDNKK